MSTRTTQFRSSLADQFGVAVGVLALVLLLGGWLAYGGFVAQGTHAEEQVVSSWSMSDDASHGATVARDTELFAANATMENRSVYYLQVMPWVNGTASTSYDAARGNLSAQMDVTLLVRAVRRQGGEITATYWNYTRTLGSTQVSGLEPGEAVAVPWAAHLNETQQRVEAFQEQLGTSSGSVEAVVVARTTYEGTVEGEPVAGTRTYELPFEMGGDVVEVRDPGANTSTFERTETVQVPNRAGPLQTVGGPLLLLLGVAGLGALAVAHRTDNLRPSDAERAALEHERQRREFDEWITRGRVPEDAVTGPRIEVEDLQGLVDLAIDTDARVVEDTARDRYVVRHDGAVYVYEPPARAS